MNIFCKIIRDVRLRIYAPVHFIKLRIYNFDMQIIIQGL
jgi:hypothetical protein